MKLLTYCVLLVGILSGCGTLGSLNPFGQSETTVITRVEGEEGVIVQPPVDDGSLLVTALSSHKLEKDREGAILIVASVLPVQGYYDGHLYRRNFGEPDENGVLYYEFRVKPPFYQTPRGSEITRTVEAADFISNGELREIKEIQIKTDTQVYRLKP